MLSPPGDPKLARSGSARPRFALEHRQQAKEQRHDPTETRCPLHSRRLGDKPRHLRQRPRACRDAQFRPDLGHLSARDARNTWPGRGSALRSDGQFRGRAHQHRRGPDRGDGSGDDRPRDRGRRLRRETRAARVHRGAPGFGRDGACRGPCLAGGRSLPHEPHRRSGARHRRRRHPGRRPRDHRRARRAPAVGRRPGRRARGRTAERRPHRHRHRPLLRHGPRQPLGAGREGLPRHRGGQGRTPERRFRPRNQSAATMPGTSPTNSSPQPCSTAMPA